MSTRITARTSTTMHSVRRFATSIVLAGALTFGGASLGSSAAYAADTTSALMASTTATPKFGIAVSTPSVALTRPLELRMTPSLQTYAPTAYHHAKRKAARLKRHKKAIRWSSARVSWYGPGFYGHTMAGGGALRPTSMIVAHRTLKFGTRILFKYHGRSVIAVVKDRGPYVSGRAFDLGPGTARALKFGGVGTVKYHILKRK